MPKKDGQDSKKESASPIMGSAVKAIYAYSPRIKRGNTADSDDVAEIIAGRSSINEGTVLNILAELRSALILMARDGKAVKLQGFGLFSPRINLKGEINISFKPDKKFKSHLNLKTEFKAEIINRDMIGKTPEELIERWNLEHPDDTV